MQSSKNHYVLISYSLKFDKNDKTNKGLGTKFKHNDSVVCLRLWLV